MFEMLSQRLGGFLADRLGSLRLEDPITDGVNRRHWRVWERDEHIYSTRISAHSS